MQLKDDYLFDQNPKQLREKWNTRWNEYFRVKSVQPAERSVEKITPLRGYIS
jgi:hypothetical protein